MKKAIGGIVAIIVIITLVAVVVLGVGLSDHWETPTEFGIWQDELTLYFADGTTESMKIIQEGKDKPFTVYYGSKEITSAKLKLTAKATGSGYDGAELKTIQMGYQAYIKDGSTILQTISGTISDRTKLIPMGTTLALFELGVDLESVVDDRPDRYSNGVYTVQFVTRGTAEYRGYPDGGDWVTASSPPSRSITINVDRTPTGSVLVTLYSEVVTS